MPAVGLPVAGSEAFEVGIRHLIALAKLHADVHSAKLNRDDRIQLLRRLLGQELHRHLPQRGTHPHLTAIAAVLDGDILVGREQRIARLRRSGGSNTDGTHRHLVSADGGNEVGQGQIELPIALISHVDGRLTAALHLAVDAHCEFAVVRCCHDCQ